MRSIKLGLAVIVFLLFGYVTGYACTCAPPPAVAQSLLDSEAVFSGKVLEVKRVKNSEQTGLWQVEVVFAVNTSWKGAEQKVISVYTASQSAACGYNFRRGRTYLVYASESMGKLATTICSRTRRHKDAGQDLKELGAGKPVRKS